MTKLKDTLVYFKNASLLWRIFAFLVLFVVISGTLGPEIINHSLVGKFGFQVYGGAGKALIFAAITFGLLVYRKRRPVEVVSWRPVEVLWVGLAVAGYTMAWIAISKLQQGIWGFWPVFLTHFGIILTIVSVALAVIGLSNIRNIARVYKRELLISVGVGVAFYGFLTLVYSLWEILATVVMHGVRWLLQLSGLDVYVVPPRILALDKFSIEISQWCSGIESIALFTGFYAIVGLIDRDKLNFRKYSIVFLPALIAIFGLNILRVYGLIMAAYYIDPHIAFSLFHTYAGMIIFVIFSAVFWMVAYKWMLKKPSSSKET